MSSTSTTTAQVRCPMHAQAEARFSCNGEAVTADFGTFSDTTVSVAPCSSLLAQGWGDQPQWVGRKSYADLMLTRVGAEADTLVRHRDGLVVFTA